MKTAAHASLYTAAASLLFALPSFAQYGAIQSGSPYTPSRYPSSHSGQSQAMHMVRAQAMLKRTLDAKSVAPGYEFRARLDHKVILDNGTELPRGTVLLGRVESDDMNLSATSKLALRFTQAILKDGETVPIKATIINAYSPGSLMDQDDADGPIQPVANDWNSNMLNFDQIGISKDVDMHSSIASKNSGVFLSTHDHDVKLPAGSEFNLAITARTGGAA